MKLWLVKLTLVVQINYHLAVDLDFSDEPNKTYLATVRTS